MPPIDPSRMPGLPATGNPLANSLPPLPKNRGEAKQMAALFIQQLESSLSAFAADDSESGESEETGGEGFSMPQMDAGMLALGGSGALASVPGAPTSLAALGLGGTPGLDGAALGASTDLLGAGRDTMLAGIGLPAPAQAAAAASAVGNGPRANAAVVAEAARKHGVDPTVAVAMMLVESGGNARAVGDNGTSFGLFQLHRGGMLTAAGLTPHQAFDPRTNAGVAMRALAHEWKKGPNRDPGAIAAASQRPADPVGYAAKVNAMLPRARALLGG